MNTPLKATVALGAAGLSLLALAGAAGAPTTTGDPALSTVFSTFNGKGAPGFGATSSAVGFDPNGGGGKLTNAESQATAQSVYEAFTFDSSAAGAFTTLAAGSMAQLQVFAVNQNVNSTGGTVNPFNLYAVLYAFNPTAAAGTVPATGPDLFGMPQKITLGDLNAGYFSGDFALAGPVVAGQRYVLGITTLNSDTQDFTQVATSAFTTQSGLPAGDQSVDTPKYLTDVNDQGNPIGKPATTIGGNNVIAFRLDAAPVPEASSVVSLGLLLGLGAAFVAFKRRRSAA